MKIDELISELEQVKEEHGNLKIRTQPDYIINNECRVRENWKGEKFFEINCWPMK